ncbi:MAG TPA: hypothetical protein VK978_00925 [Candidatus Saccharimonadales bacterium]|nr:hypothetical protein [Candidatus Saccharimonadales bacterium]
MYRTYNARPVPRPYRSRGTRRGVITSSVAVAIILVAYILYALLRPLPALKTTLLPPVVPAQMAVNIPWPVAGQAAFGADEYGLLASHGAQTPRPMASVTKAITALAVLEKKPLRHGETGPPIIMTQRDVDFYQQYAAKDGAIVPVSIGQSVTEYQALQAMLLPSANNLADTTALWAFGSMDAYTKYANSMVKKLGMTQTTITDASGFAPTTVSTASDLVKLGDAVLDHPVLAEIISQKQAEFPGYGTMNNVNNLLGQSGIRGIKTGNTDEAGGCYLSAADIYIGNQKVTVITAILGSASRPQAMKDSVPMIQSAVSEFQRVHVVRSGQEAGTVTAPWGAQSKLTASKDISVFSWTGTALAPRAAATSLETPVAADTTAGTFSLTYTGQTQTADLRLRDAIAGPSAWWRLTHPL